MATSCHAPSPTPWASCTGAPEWTLAATCWCVGVGEQGAQGLLGCSAAGSPWAHTRAPPHTHTLPQVRVPPAPSPPPASGVYHSGLLQRPYVPAVRCWHDPRWYPRHGFHLDLFRGDVASRCCCVHPSYLDVSYNELVGTVPTALGALTGLSRNLILSNNQLSGQYVSAVSDSLNLSMPVVIRVADPHTPTSPVQAPRQPWKSHKSLVGECDPWHQLSLLFCGPIPHVLHCVPTLLLFPPPPHPAPVPHETGACSWAKTT